MRIDLDLMTKIIRENIIENQTEMKTVFDDKVTLYPYVVGGVVLLNDPVENVGIPGKLRRHWVGLFTITFLNSHSCRLVNDVTGKVMNNLVHIYRIKPYFYRDELPEDPDMMEDNVLEQLADGMAGETSKPVVVSQGHPRVIPVKGCLGPKKAQRVHVKRLSVPKKQKGGRKKRVGVTEPTNIGGPVVTQLEVLDEPGSTDDEETEVPLPDMDIMYEAECILKQRRKKGGKKEFLVRWVDKEARDTWTIEEDVSDALLLHWWTSHTRTGTK